MWQVTLRSCVMEFSFNGLQYLYLFVGFSLNILILLTTLNVNCSAKRWSNKVSYVGPRLIITLKNCQTEVVNTFGFDIH